jgi:hypothetical protein
MQYRLYVSAGYLGSHPAFADSADFDALRLWVVKHNDWKGRPDRRSYRVRRWPCLVRESKR